MRIDVDAPVVVRVENDRALLDVIHLPAERIGGRGSGGDHRSLATVTASGYFGLRIWPTLCGLDGVVFAMGGSIRKALRRRDVGRVCSVCMKRVKGGHFEIPAPLPVDPIEELAA